MKPGVGILSLGAALVVMAQSPMDRLLTGVEKHYNSPRTMHMVFEQSQSGGGRIGRIESGELFLAKPGRMRWDYRSPAGKLFVTDGKFAYYYSPSLGRAERSRIKEAEDIRAPLAFLFGQLDFRRDFKEFRTQPDGANTYLVATPKSEKAPYRQVAFLITPDYRIAMLRVTGQDDSVTVYKLSEERVNPALEARLFQFQAPAGVEVVDQEP